MTGNPDDGIEELRGALADYGASGAYIEWPHFLGMLADALLRAGRAREARQRLDEALAVIGGRPYFYEPALRRLLAATV